MNSAGDLIRAWRENVLGWDHSKAANQLQWSRPNLTKREGGTLELHADDLAHLDRVYGARGTLIDMVPAMTTRALPARREWTHNYDHLPQPIWIWLRPGTDAHEVLTSLNWGPLHVNVRRETGPDGVIVTAPTSVTNPPLEVRLEQDGWVDFGRGVVPRKLGIPVIDGVAALPDDRPATGLYERARGVVGRRRLGDLFALASEFGLTGAKVRPHLVTLLPGSVPALELLDAEGQAFPDGRLMDGAKLLEYREARKLSRAKASAKMTELDHVDATVSADALRSVEQNHASRVPRILSRLDTVLRLDGRSCAEPVVRVEYGVQQVNFPSYWVGPVWATFRAPEPAYGTAPLSGTPLPASKVVLTWGPWRRTLRVSSGTTITTRRASKDAGPLNVNTIARGWTVQVGVGLPPGAHDVGEGWRPAGAAGIKQLLGERLAGARRQRDAADAARARAAEQQNRPETP